MRLCRPYFAAVQFGDALPRPSLKAVRALPGMADGISVMEPGPVSGPLASSRTVAAFSVRIAARLPAEIAMPRALPIIIKIATLARSRP